MTLCWKVFAAHKYVAVCVIGYVLHPSPGQCRLLMNDFYSWGTIASLRMPSSTILQCYSNSCACRGAIHRFPFSSGAASSAWNFRGRIWTWRSVLSIPLLSSRGTCIAYWTLYISCTFCHGLCWLPGIRDHFNSESNRIVASSVPSGRLSLPYCWSLRILLDT